MTEALVESGRKPFGNKCLGRAMGTDQQNRSFKGKCGERLFDALNALLMPKPEYVAMRLKKAMMASDER